jgi:uncharacterized protein (DUF58 family)
MALSIATETFGRFERLAFVGHRPARAGPGGEHRSRRPSPSPDFIDYRPYQPGDDFRRVDWNVYGRLGTLQVKVTEGRQQLDVVLVLDCSSSMAYGQPDKLAFATQLVAALAHIGTSRVDTVRIVALVPTSSPTQAFGPFARRKMMPDVVRALSAIAPAGLVDLNAALAACLTDSVRQPLVVVVSDLLSPGGAAAGLNALQVARADVVVVHVVSPDELSPIVSGEVELVDAETNQVLELGVSLATLAAYKERFATWLGDREADCTARNMRYARVQTDRPLASVVLDDLRRVGLLR